MYRSNIILFILLLCSSFQYSYPDEATTSNKIRQADRPIFYPKEVTGVLPETLLGKLEISPQKPKLGEPAYVRFTLENTDKEPITIPESYCIHWKEAIFGSHDFILDLDTQVKIPFPYMTFKIIGSKYVFAPWRKEPGQKGQVTTLASKEKRIQFLEEIVLNRELEKKEAWQSFVDAKDATLRYCSFYGPHVDFKPYYVSIPVRFSNDSVDTLLNIWELKKEKPRIERKYSRELKDLPWSSSNMSLEDREELEKLYPAGTAKAKEYLLNTWERIQMRGSTDEDVGGFGQWLWTLPEIERQYYATNMLGIITKEKAEGLFRSRKFFIEILRMCPKEYIISTNDVRSNAIVWYCKYRNFSQEELEQDLTEALKQPIPVDAGKGNDIRGFIK